MFSVWRVTSVAQPWWDLQPSCVILYFTWLGRKYSENTRHSFVCLLVFMMMFFFQAIFREYVIFWTLTWVSVTPVHRRMELRHWCLPPWLGDWILLSCWWNGDVISINRTISVAGQHSCRPHTMGKLHLNFISNFDRN